MQLESWLGALRERNFRLYFVGQLTSAVGSGMAPVAISFAVLALPHGSASEVGIVLTAGAVPLVLFLLVGGVIADRLGRRVVMLGADLLRCLAQAVLALWILVGHPPLWGFVVLAALVGLGEAFFTPASTGLIQQVVSLERRTQANALNGLSFSIGGIIGPALAGIIVAVSSPGWGVAADSLSYFVSVVTLFAMHVAHWERLEDSSFVHQLKEGWREFWSRTWLWVIVVEASLLNVLVMAPFMVLGPVVAKESLGGAPAWGTILAGFAAGSVAGGIVMLRLRFRRPLAVACLTLVVVAAPLMGLAVVAPTAVITAGAFLGGWSFAMFQVLWDTTMQREIPPELLARVSA
jgi:MFS family permease